MNDPKQWWNNNLPTKVDAFADWIGDHNAETKRIIAEYIAKKRYGSVLDLACGNQTFKKSLEVANSSAKYTGVDSSIFWTDEAIIHNDIEDLKDIPDSSHSVVFARHILEHLPTFQKGLGEAIRVAKKEIIIVFFNKPQDKEEIRTVVDGSIVYTNIYSKKDIEEFIKDYKFEWQDINEQEVILYIKK